MLQSAYHSYAMENAPAEVKSMQDLLLRATEISIDWCK